MPKVPTKKQSSSAAIQDFEPVAAGVSVAVISLLSPCSKNASKAMQDSGTPPSRATDVPAEFARKGKDDDEWATGSRAGPGTDDRASFRRCAAAVVERPRRGARRR